MTVSSHMTCSKLCPKTKRKDLLWCNFRETSLWWNTR